MKKHTILSLGSCICGSLLLVALLANNTKPVHAGKNGFQRKLFPGFAKNTGYIDLGYNSYYMAGISAEKVFLGNAVAHTLLLSVNHTLKDSQHLVLTTPVNYRIRWAFTKLSVQYPDIYLSEGATPTVLHSTLPSILMEAQPLPGCTGFYESIPLSPSSFALKTYDSKISQDILSKNIPDSPYIINQGILRKQVDGKFCTDGEMLFDRGSRRLVYVYFYRNEYICLDTNLNIMYRGRTIDTCSVAKIRLDSTTSMKSFSSPPLVVNKKSCVSGNRLYIISNLVADNEEQDSFRSKTVIDIYDLDDGQYISSFYIPAFRSKKVSDFGINGNVLFAIQGKYMTAYKLLKVSIQGSATYWDHFAFAKGE